MAIRPILIDDDSPFSDENCALCKEPFVSGEEIVVCPDDATRHHIQCWIANGNRCTAYACSGHGQPITRLESGTDHEFEEDELEDGSVVLEGVVEPRRSRVGGSTFRPRQGSKVRTMPSSSFGCAQGCLILAIAIAIVIMAISCFGLWAIADFIMIELLNWDYREPISLLQYLPTLNLVLPLL